MARYILVNNPNGNSGYNCCCDSIDGNAAIFFNNLAKKLVDMSKSIEKRIEDLSNKVCQPESKGILMASIDTPSMMLGIKYEYVEYVRRYGPPIKGKFDPILLEEIRTDLGIKEVII